MVRVSQHESAHASSTYTYVRYGNEQAIRCYLRRSLRQTQGPRATATSHDVISNSLKLPEVDFISRAYVDLRRATALVIGGGGHFWGVERPWGERRGGGGGGTSVR